LERKGYLDPIEKEDHTLANTLGTEKSNKLKRALLRRGMSATRDVLVAKPKDEFI